MNKYINTLMKEVKKTFKTGDIPVAAIIIKNNKIISKAHNTKYKNKQSIEHAEINAIRLACKKLKTERLDDCILFSTLEPCKMCYGAIAEAHIKNVYFLTKSNYLETSDNFLNKIERKKISCNNEYEEVLSSFFKKMRNML